MKTFSGIAHTIGNIFIPTQHREKTYKMNEINLVEGLPGICSMSQLQKSPKKLMTLQEKPVQFSTVPSTQTVFTPPAAFYLKQKQPGHKKCKRLKLIGKSLNVKFNHFPRSFKNSLKEPHIQHSALSVPHPWTVFGAIDGDPGSANPGSQQMLLF